jgi:hypothetical protein
MDLLVGNSAWNGNGQVRAKQADQEFAVLKRGSSRKEGLGDTTKYIAKPAVTLRIGSESIPRRDIVK